MIIKQHARLNHCHLISPPVTLPQLIRGKLRLHCSGVIFLIYTVGFLGCEGHAESCALLYMLYIVVPYCTTLFAFLHFLVNAPLQWGDGALNGGVAVASKVLFPPWLWDDIETAEQKRARRKGLRRATDLHLSGLLSAASKKLRNHRKPTNSIVDNSGYVDMHQANSIKM